MSDHDLLIQIDARLTSLEEKVVTKVDLADFVPVKVFVYGLIAVVTTSFLLAVTGIVYSKMKDHMPHAGSKESLAIIKP